MFFSCRSFSVEHRRRGSFSLLAFLLLASCSDGILQNIGLPEQGGFTTPRISTPMVDAPPSTYAQPFSNIQSSPPFEEKKPLVPLTVQESFAPAQTKVALLVPLSGKNAALGQAMVNAAQLAVFDVSAEGFELLPRDTGINAVQAVRAAKDALAAGAHFIIGPLFAADVAAVRPVVKASSVNMLALSTDTSLGEAGAYVMGFAPAPQVERVVSYAFSKGLRKFAALVPTNPYGNLVAQTFERVVKERGGEVVAIEKVNNLAFLATKKDNIEALLVPFGGAELGRVAGQLEKAGFDKNKVRLLGTGLWDEGLLATEQPFLIGGWYATAEPEARERFISSYEKAYGEGNPPRLATLSYDATALAAVLAKTGRGFDQTALTNPVGFVGLDGVFRFGQNGQVERNLAISEIAQDGNKIIDPAPTSFE